MEMEEKRPGGREGLRKRKKIKNTVGPETDTELITPCRERRYISPGHQRCRQVKTSRHKAKIPLF